MSDRIDDLVEIVQVLEESIREVKSETVFSSALVRYGNEPPRTYLRGRICCHMVDDILRRDRAEFTEHQREDYAVVHTGHLYLLTPEGYHRLIELLMKVRRPVEGLKGSFGDED